MSVRTIQRIERGGKASLETLGALASVLEVEISALARETDMHSQQHASIEEREAVEYVRDIKGFYSHLAIYLISSAAMIVANLFTGTDNLWFIWPVFGWGLGVASHGLAVFEVLSVFGVDWEKRQIERWLQCNRNA